MPQDQEFSLYLGDSTPLISRLFKDDAAVDLTTAQFVKVIFLPRSGATPLLTVNASSSDSSGIVIYNWGTNDLATLGTSTFRIRYQVKNLSGTIDTYPDPSQGNLVLRVAT